MTTTYVTLEQRRAVTARVVECLTHFLGGNGPLLAPKISYDLKGTSGVVANAQNNELRLNPVVLCSDFPHFLRYTLGHAMAHLISYGMHGPGTAPHGKEWQGVMSRIGLPAERCNSYVGPGPRKLSSLGSPPAPTGMLLKRLAHRTNTGNPEGSYGPGPQSHKVQPKLRLPSEAMLTFARELSVRRRVPLPVNIATSYAICADYLDQFKNMPPRDVLPATAKQLELVARLRGTGDAAPPDYVLADKWLTSLWIKEKTGLNAGSPRRP